jgi:hypothetical protein
VEITGQIPSLKITCKAEVTAESGIEKISLSPSDDAVIWSKEQENGHNDAFMDLKMQSGDYRKILIKFDLREIGSLKDAETMILKLYKHYSKDCTASIRASYITEPVSWEEETATWKEADRFEKEEILEQEFEFKADEGLKEVALDFSGYLEEIQERNLEEISFLIELADTTSIGTTITFASKENENPDRKPPVLEIISDSSTKILSVEEIPSIQVLTGTDIEGLKLPEAVNVQLEDGSSMELPVKSWEPEYGYYPDFAGTYGFVGDLELPEGISNPDRLQAKIEVCSIEAGNKYMLQVLQEEARTLIGGESDSLEGEDKENLTAAYEKAEEVLTDSFAKEEEIQDVYTQLLHAMWNLKPLDEIEPPERPEEETDDDESDDTDDEEVLSDEGVSGTWQNENGLWTFTLDNGIQARHTWILTDEHWYWFDDNGNMATDWVCCNDKWYYLQDDGAMLEDTWLFNDGTWYYLEKDGKMKENQWFFYKDKWYYLGQGGKMAVSTTTPDGYQVNERGEWIP